jgi:hypothetical protein
MPKQEAVRIFDLLLPILKIRRRIYDFHIRKMIENTFSKIEGTKSLQLYKTQNFDSRTLNLL